MTTHNADELWEAQEYRDRIAELEERLEAARYEATRWKDVTEKQASWEKLWAEQVERAEAAEKARDYWHQKWVQANAALEAKS